MCLALNVKAANSKSKNLGLSLLRGNSKKNSLAFIYDKILKKVQGWNTKFLSQASREILVKAGFRLPPRTLCHVFHSCYHFAISWICSSIDLFRVALLRVRKFIGNVGRLFHLLKVLEVLVFVTSKCLTLLLSLNKFGACCLAIPVYVLRYWGPSIFQVNLFWMLRWVRDPPRCRLV